MKDMSDVVVTRPIPSAGWNRIREERAVQVYDRSGWTEDELIEVGRRARALVTMLSDPITRRVLASCPDLAVVAQYAVGVDNIDLEAAEELGIAVSHTPGVLTEATADMAMALLLGVARRLRPADRYVRAGRFERWETQLLLGTELSGKSMGIVGLGRIGAATARRAMGFGMSILYCNRSRANATVERLLDAERVSREELLERSDVVSLHCPLNEASRHFIDEEALRHMKDSALLVNTARGPVVDEAALVRALERGWIAGAGLDVFEDEPEVHPGLLELDNVLLAPHLGSATQEARDRMAEMCARSVQAALEGVTDIPYRIA